MIIGLTGPIASGKSTLVYMFLERGFVYLTLSDEVRNEALRRHIPIQRTQLQDLGNDMRKKNGMGYWAELLIGKMNENNDYIIDGIRNRGEIDSFRKIGDFKLIGITAPLEKRYERILLRAKESDPKTVEEIKRMEERDRGIGEAEFGQHTDECYSLADKFIVNDGSVDDLRLKVSQLISELNI